MSPRVVGPSAISIRRLNLSEDLDGTRICLSRPGAQLPLALLGLITGLIAGGVIVVFRLLV